MNRVVLAVVGLAVLSVTVHAAEEPRFTFVADTGWSSPQNSSFGGALHVGGGVNHRLTNWFSVQGLVTYSHYPVSQEGAQVNWAQILGNAYTYKVNGGALSNVTFAGELKIALAGIPKEVVPYAIVGGGVTRSSEAASTVSMLLADQVIDQASFSQETSLRGMATVACGADIPVKRRVRVFAELRYQMIHRSTGHIEDIGLRFGVRLAP
jgi:hypothetical protein